MPSKYTASLIAAAFVLAPLVAHGQSQDAPAMPDGKGKQLVEGLCSACHSLSLIKNSSGYSRDQWRELTSYMVNLSGSPAQQNEVLDYLAKNFPAGDSRRPAKAMPGFRSEDT